ncbi:MAG: hypothetical protein PHT40_01625 [Patescibacteria group bacterium]|nr:hypothetical protein [Patescibacteria group bacterium]
MKKKYARVCIVSVVLPLIGFLGLLLLPKQSTITTTPNVLAAISLVLIGLGGGMFIGAYTMNPIRSIVKLMMKKKS